MGCLTYCDTAITATLSCASCSTYVMTIGSTNYTYSCPTGTVCYVATSSSTSSNSSTSTTEASTGICASSNACDGTVCNRYAVWPSSSSCSQYHVCRYISGYSAYVVSTLTCPGSSQFDQLTNKCTLSSSVSCYNSTST